MNSPPPPDIGSSKKQLEDFTRICVLVDATEEDGSLAGRRNYWKYVETTAGSPITFDAFSLREMSNLNVVFNFDEYDTVIVNTDLANGDPIFGSDQSLMFFLYQGEKRKDAWFRNGKHPRLIIEHQGLRLIPSQRAYDAILGHGEVDVPTFEPYFTALVGGSCRVVPYFADHPCLQHVDGTKPLEPSPRRPELRPFFGNPAPRWLGAEEGPKVGSVFEARVDSLYGGWFEEWDSEWLPLLKVSENSLAPENNATVLVKVIEENEYAKRNISPEHRRKGVIIATTMRLGALAPSELLKGLLEADYADIVRYHERAHRRRAQINFVLYGLILLSFVLSTAASIFIWDIVIADSNSKAIRYFSDAVGLPLIVILLMHYSAARHVSRRSYFAGPRHKTPYYYLRCIFGFTRRKLGS